MNRSVSRRFVLLLLAVLAAAPAGADDSLPIYVPLAPFGPTEPIGQPAIAGPYAPRDQADRLELLGEQVLDLEPDRNNRRLIEQVRLAEEDLLGVDVTDEPWQHVDSPSFTWGGRMEGEYVTWANDREFGGQPNYFAFRRLRLFAAGEGYGVFDYNLEFEFVRGEAMQADVVDNQVNLGAFGVDVQDAYLGARDVPFFGYVRIGNFFTPAGLEQLTANRNLTFMERSLAHRMVPGREVGVAALNHSLDQNFTWSYGVFFHEIPEDAHVVEDDNQGLRLAARGTHTPYYDELSDGRYLVHGGLSYIYTQPRRRANPEAPGLPFYPVDFDARPEINRSVDLVNTGDLNTRRYHVLDAEAAVVWGPLSVQGEAVWTRVDEYQLGSIDLYGAYVFASYFLTGENRSYNRREGSFGRARPHENFWMVQTPIGPQAGWGAWEVAARWSYLDFSDIAGQQLNNLTVGCNWYWNPNVRLMFNWIHPFSHNSPAAIVPNAEGDILATRLEVFF